MKSTNFKCSNCNSIYSVLIYELQEIQHIMCPICGTNNVLETLESVDSIDIFSFCKWVELMNEEFPNLEPIKFEDYEKWKVEYKLYCEDIKKAYEIL